MRRDELAAVLLEAQVIGPAGAQRLAQEDEVGDSADEIFDGRALGIEASGSRVPQGGGHAFSVIGLDQEMVKRTKKFSNLSLG